jgi:hypothetical protein
VLQIGKKGNKTADIKHKPYSKWSLNNEIRSHLTSKAKNTCMWEAL